MLDWMSAQDLASLAALLPLVEGAVLEAHRALYERDGRAWSRPIAYHWLHYEDPHPLDRLREGVEKLVRQGAAFDPAAVEKACAEAEKSGFSI